MTTTLTKTGYGIYRVLIDGQLAGRVWITTISFESDAPWRATSVSPGPTAPNFKTRQEAIRWVEARSFVDQAHAAADAIEKVRES